MTDITTEAGRRLVNADYPPMDEFQRGLLAESVAAIEAEAAQRALDDAIGRVTMACIAQPKDADERRWNGLVNTILAALREADREEK